MIWAKRAVLTAVLAGLVTSNILAITSTTFHTALAGAIAATTGIATVTDKLRARNRKLQGTISRQSNKFARQKSAARNIGRKISARTRKAAARSIAAIPGEAVPIIGWSVLLGATAYELKVACDNINDLDALYRELGIDEEVERDTMRTVCNPDLPSRDELWGKVDQELEAMKDSIGNSQQQLIEWVQHSWAAIPEWLQEFLTAEEDQTLENPMDT